MPNETPEKKERKARADENEKFPIGTKVAVKEGRPTYGLVGVVVGYDKVNGHSVLSVDTNDDGTADVSVGPRSVTIVKG